VCLGLADRARVEDNPRHPARLQLLKIRLGDMRNVTGSIFAVDFDLSSRDDKDPDKDTYTTYPKEYRSPDDR
jgi:hypothetical protein